MTSDPIYLASSRHTQQRGRDEACAALDILLSAVNGYREVSLKVLPDPDEAKYSVIALQFEAPVSETERHECVEYMREQARLAFERARGEVVDDMRIVKRLPPDRPGVRAEMIELLMNNHAKVNGR